MEDEEPVPAPKWKICCRKCFLTRRCMRHNFFYIDGYPVEKLIIGFLLYSVLSSGLLIYAIVSFDNTMKNLVILGHKIEKAKELNDMIEDIIFANIFYLIWACTVCILSFVTLCINYFSMPDRNMDFGYWCCVSCTFSFGAFLSWFLIPNIMNLYNFMYQTYEFPEKSELDRQIFLVFIGLALNVVFILMGVIFAILMIICVIAGIVFVTKIIFDCVR